jgi:flavin reductase (DIM6/NTAB) family NADH-FMN oxidoreductase RutF
VITMKKTRIPPFRPVYPSPAVLVTSVDEDGKPNVMTVGEAFNVSIKKPVIVGIAIRKATYTHGLISRTREYVVNCPSTAIVDKVDQCGAVSGRDGVDKFERFGLTPLPAAIVKPPLIAECPLNIECKVLDIHVIGDHDLFTGEVVAVHVDEDKLDADGKILTDRLDVLGYMSGQYWSMGELIGTHGFTKRRGD